MTLNKCALNVKKCKKPFNGDKVRELRFNFYNFHCFFYLHRNENIYFIIFFYKSSFSEKYIRVYIVKSGRSK